MTRYATIIGSGSYIPEIEISNATFAEWMGELSPKLAEVVGKFEASSGIKTRFYAPDDWATSDLLRSRQEPPSRSGINPKISTWSFWAQTALITSRQLHRLWYSIKLVR